MLWNEGQGAEIMQVLLQEGIQQNDSLSVQLSILLTMN